MTGMSNSESCKREAESAPTPPVREAAATGRCATACNCCPIPTPVAPEAGDEVEPTCVCGAEESSHPSDHGFVEASRYFEGHRDFVDEVLDYVVNDEVGELGLRVKDVLAIAEWLAPMVAARDARMLAEGAVGHRDLVSRLGFGDNITEPMAGNDWIVEFFEQQGKEAAEWRESQNWRNDCIIAGHPEDEDCTEHDPMFAYDRGLADGAEKAWDEGEESLWLRIESAWREECNPYRRSSGAL